MCKQKVASYLYIIKCKLFDVGASSGTKGYMHVIHNTNDYLIDDEFEAVIRAEQQRLVEQRNWLTNWKKGIDKLPDLPESPWIEPKIIQPIFTADQIPKYMPIAAVDGGVLVEELQGFDIILSRAVVPVFTGVGTKVDVQYYPNFDPKPIMLMRPSFSSRFDLQKYVVLARLQVEYLTALEAITTYHPKVLFIDGASHPLQSDLNADDITEPQVSELLHKVKQTYVELIRTAQKEQVVLLGIIKDSRSRGFTNTVIQTLVHWIKHQNIPPIQGFRSTLGNMLDIELSRVLLDEGQRTAWYQITTPRWIPTGLHIEYWTSLLSIHRDDFPVKVEVICYKEEWFGDALNTALRALTTLTQHGLPLNLPTIILEADERTKIHQNYLNELLEQLSVMLGIPVSQLKKRRTFTA